MNPVEGCGGVRRDSAGECRMKMTVVVGPHLTQGEKADIIVTAL